MAKYTIFGGRGFIGSEIVEQLNTLNHSVWVPERSDPAIFEENLGIVIYCAGNGDCSNTPFSVFEANSVLLSEVLRRSTFERLIYISSTRVYMNNDESHENSDLLIRTDDNRRLFNLTKLVAEELCLKSGKPITIVRPSNVYGLALNSPLFLPSITKNAILNGYIDMFVPGDYAKDYVSVSDVARSVLALSQCKGADGKIINIASGHNVTSQEISACLVAATNCKVNWHSNIPSKEVFPVTCIELLKELIPDYNPRSVLSDLSEMVEMFKNELNTNS